MQSLNSTCQEADYLLGDGFCTFKKPALKPQSKLLVKRYSNVSSLPPPSIPSSSSSPSCSLSQQQSSTPYGSSSSSKSNSHSSRSSTGSKNGKKGGSSSSIIGGSPPKRSKFSSSTSTSGFSLNSSSSSTNGGGSSSTYAPTSSYDIHDRLKTLHLELLREDNSLKNMLSLRCTSFLLEKLIARDKLNTLILNLYPGNKGYSLAFRLDKKTTELTNSQDNPVGGSSSNSLINNKNTSKIGAASLSSSSSTSSNNKLNSNSNINISNNENLQETMRWPYEDEDLLESIDNEELPLILVDIIEKKCPHLFYSGCVIAEIRDYRQSFPIYTCDTSHVLLKPTNQTLFADVNLITSEGNWSAEDKLRLESQLVLATAQPLCLDPNPNVGILSINQQHTRNLLNTPSIRRQSKKYSQVAINRKRKLDQFTHNYGLELSDFMQKYRKRTTSKQSGAAHVGTSNNCPKKPSDILPIRTPNLDLPPTLSIPEEINVEKYAKTFERPRETKDCQPQLIEQYILETDRADKQTYHIKLSLYQRPSNYEFLGELYVDKNHRDGERNGEACQFSLGTRAHANRYIQQFTEIFTEEGRKSVKITHYIPGQPPRISCTARMWEHRIQQQAAIQQQQQLQQQQVIQQLNPIQPQLNTTATPQQIISASQSSNIINIRQTPQSQVNPPVYQNCTTQVVQQMQQQPTQQIQQQQHLQQNTQIAAATGAQLAQINLNNNRPVLLVKPPGGNITNLTINTQSNQQARSNLGTPVPVLQAQLQSHSIQSPQQIQQIQQQPPEPLTPTIHSTNPEINALATGLMNSANQFQQRFAAAKNRQQQQQQQQQHQQQQQQQQQQRQQNASGSSNAAIISLLNSAPAAMTNSPVLSNNQVAVDSLMSRKPTAENTIMQTQQLPQKLFSTTTGNPTSVRKLSTNIQATQQQQQAGLSRILNHSNLIAVSSVGNQTQLINVQQQPDGSYQQTGNDRVSLSALASQLASPPAVMTSPIIQQTQTIQNNQNFNVHNFQQQGSITKQVLINSVNPRLLATQGGNAIHHRESSVTSPGSDSNASSSSAIGYSMAGLNALLATSPSPVSIDLNSNNSNSALIERLTSPSSTISGQFTAPSPKNINIQQQSQQQQHIQVQSPASISPMSSPPPPQQQQPQTTTLNLQGLNLASLQGAISTIPGLQNVQVQIPGIPQPISLSLSGPTNTNATLNAQPTSLLVSVPVTNTTQVNQMQSIPSSGATQTVVLTNAQGGGGGSNLLSLPIAQFVTTSNVKGLNQQTIRTTNSGNQPFQLVGTIQRPRGIQVAGSSLVNTKQLTARALVATPQRGSTLKIATPINATSSQLQTNLQSNHIVMAAAQQQFQLKLQKQLQQCNNAASVMPQIITKSQVGALNTSNPGSNVGAININNSVITAALQGNHRRRSGTETNK